MIVTSRAELDALVATGQPPAPRPLPVLPCRFRGDPLTGYAREARGLDHARDWRACEHPARPLGGVVCPCQGCGPRCAGYTAEGGLGAAPSGPGWLTIPDPPALDLTPASSRAVVTVVVGAEAEACFASSGPLTARYAARHGADLVVLRWPGHPDWPMSAKFAIGKVLDHYERIAYVDADVLLRPGCADLFDMCAPHEMGVCDELAYHRANPGFAREAEYQRFRAEMGFRPVPHLPWYFNAGVMVVPRSHRGLLLPPAGPMPTGHCAEQDHTNARLLDSGLPYRTLDRRANWQNWTDHGFKSAPRDAVLHWSGAGGDRVSRAEQMRRRAAPHLAPFVSPESTHPEWEVDRRHLLWLSEELLSGRHRRVLEIGCYRGYSTSAFLHALRVGAVDEVHLCEVAPTPELLALAEGVPGVTLHRCPSVELLDRDDAARFDLVFVDGDHSAATCAAEARLLVAAGVRVVFAHDTAAHPRYAGCEGPPLLKAALGRAGYALAEDAEPRPGELTDRGMLLARRGVS